MSDSEEKTLEPTTKKLRKAREKGQIPQFRDMRLLLLTATGVAFVWFMFDQIADYFRTSIQLAILAITDDQISYDSLVSHALSEGTRIVGLFFVILVSVLIVSSLVLNKGLVISFDPMVPKMSNMDPVKGFQRIFGVRAITELAKSLLRLIAGAAGVYLIFRYAVGSLVYAPFCGMACLLDLLLTLSAMIFGLIIFIALISAILDMPLQVWLFNRDQKMTRTEMKNEMKDSHGSPEIRKAIRRLRNEAAQSTGKVGIGKSTIIIFGDHYAVGLRYAKEEVNIPILVARAKGDRTEEFLEKARYLMVPFFRDDSLAERLFRARPGYPINEGEFAETAKAILMTSNN